MPNVTTALPIRSDAASIYHSFIEPEHLTRFWLARASGPLRVGAAVEWEFLVPGATVKAAALTLEPGKRIAFAWDGGVIVTIVLVEDSGETIVTIEVGGFGEDPHVAADLIAGFTLVLSDLKILLETGRSPGLVAEKARLIARAGGRR